MDPAVAVMMAGQLSCWLVFAYVGYSLGGLNRARVRKEITPQEYQRALTALLHYGVLLVFLILMLSGLWINILQNGH